LIKRTDPFLL